MATPVTITNAGAPITPGVMGAPVTIVGGTLGTVSNGQQLTIDVDGSPEDVTFTVVAGAITAITIAP